LELEPFRDEDDRHNLGLLADWFPDPAVRRRILVDNPARLFGFET
jgi:2-pyrone-4,6-dicarboxylate lactonase